MTSTGPDDELDSTTAPIPVMEAEAVHPVPGTVLSGRYRLVEACGSEPHVQFWQGINAASGQLVGLSLIDVDGAFPVERVNEILSRTVRMRGLDVRGVARITEVFYTGSFGVVVSDWVPGGTARQAADTRPVTIAVA